MLIDQRAAREPLQGIWFGQVTLYTVGDGLRERPAAARGRLEPARAPAAVEEQSRDRRRVDDRGRIGADVDDAPPRAQQGGVLEHGEQLARRRHLMLDHME